MSESIDFNFPPKPKAQLIDWLDPDLLYEECPCKGAGFCLACFDELLIPHDH